MSNSTQGNEIGHWLELAERDWTLLPNVAAEIDGWELLQQLEFTEAWPLAEMRLEHLAALRDAMNEKQRRRYSELLALVQKNRPLLQGVLS